MEVEFTTTLDDYVIFSMHMYRKSKVGRGTYLASWLLLPFGCLLIGIGLAMTEGPSVLAVSCAVAGALYAAVYPLLYHRWVANYVRAYATQFGSRGVIGPIRLILTDVSLIEITELTRTEARWRDMAGIEEVDDYTFIMVTGLSAAILPQHGFKREEDYFKARDFARARISDRG